MIFTLLNIIGIIIGIIFLTGLVMWIYAIYKIKKETEKSRDEIKDDLKKILN